MLELLDSAGEVQVKSWYWTTDFLRGVYWLWHCSRLNPCCCWIGSTDTWWWNSIRCNSEAISPRWPNQSTVCYIISVAPCVCVLGVKVKSRTRFTQPAWRHTCSCSRTADVTPTQATLDTSEKGFDDSPEDGRSCKGAIREKVTLAALQRPHASIESLRGNTHHSMGGKAQRESESRGD